MGRVTVIKDDAVAVIDTTQNKVLRTISVPKGTHGLVVTPDGRKVDVSRPGVGERRFGRTGFPDPRVPWS
jgi:DNA-binding beta-propeller fold protein YncE